MITLGSPLLSFMDDGLPGISPKDGKEKRELNGVEEKLRTEGWKQKSKWVLKQYPHRLYDAGQHVNTRPPCHSHGDKTSLFSLETKHLTSSGKVGDSSFFGLISGI
ncbi:unnamed protein product [Caretta caretta]